MRYLFGDDASAPVGGPAQESTEPRLRDARRPAALPARQRARPDRYRRLPGPPDQRPALAGETPAARRPRGGGARPRHLPGPGPDPSAGPSLPRGAGVARRP